MTPATDFICLGRAAVDLYGLERGARLEDTQNFAKYLGGSSANVAVGLARLGLRVAMLTRVGNEHMGRFVRETLAAEGVDVAAVGTDPGRLTGLVLLGIEDAENFPHIFYRENCADMGLEAADVEPAPFATARALAMTGTHLSTESVRRAARRAIALAKQHGLVSSSTSTTVPCCGDTPAMAAARSARGIVPESRGSFRLSCRTATLSSARKRKSASPAAARPRSTPCARSASAPRDHRHEARGRGLRRVRRTRYRPASNKASSSRVSRLTC